MKARMLAAALLGLVWAAGAPAQEAEQKENEELTPAERVAIAEKLAPFLVRVEYTLRTDKGEEPQVGGWTRRCPNCGRYHGLSANQYIQEERPLEVEGYLVSPTRVLTPDIIVHPRFVEKIEVAFGEDRVGAKPSAFAVEQDGLFLELERPLEGAEPLEFDASREPPYLSVSYDSLNGTWTIVVEPLSLKASAPADDEPFLATMGNTLVVDSEGVPVAAPMRGDLPVDDSWKGSPEAWPTVSAEDLAARREAIARKADQAILRVELHFRSPKKQEREEMYRRDEESATDRSVPGLLVSGKRILVLANLEPKVTARLERIRVHRAEGEPVAATFEHTLNDYGALVAALETPLEGALELADGDIRDFKNVLLTGAEVRIQGESRQVYLCRRRIAGFDEGWRRNLYPMMPGSGQNTFLFDTEGNLVALPITRREKAGPERQWRGREAQLTAAAQLAPVLADVAAHTDPNNVPLSEEEESRLAWMGVILQPLDRELARANKVSHLTQDGETGALVSYVYPGSPAVEAGIEPGWVLLRLHVADYPKPIDVKCDSRGEWRFPWDRLDELSEQYYDRIPPPWPPAENTFTRTVTDIGFGKTYRAEFADGGEVVFKEFEVVQSPPHFAAAPKFKAEDLGLTVRDMTYEVRRYFQKEPDDPGVIISMVEPGSKASVGGIKPFEMVTHVNDKPVANVKDFERLIAGERELRLSVKRMMQGRLVRITLSAPEKKEEKDAETEPPAK